MLVTTGRPTVRVPVLSKTTASTRPACSRCEPPLMRMPRRAPLPIAALIAVGVARPTAQGHATSSIVIARRTSRVTSKVTADNRKDAGTKRREKFSPMVWMGARSCWACSTRVMIRPMVVSLPTASARHHEPAPDDHRTGVDAGACLDADGQGLAGDRGLVDDRFARRATTPSTGIAT